MALTYTEIIVQTLYLIGSSCFFVGTLINMLVRIR